jgi:hypothetical protein
MSRSQPSPRKVLAAKLLLSAGVILAGWEFLQLTTAVFVALRQTEMRRANPDPLLLQHPAPADPLPRAAVPWPRFPLRSEQYSHECMLNGVRLLTEEWEGAGRPQDVLDFYRGQMQARGWVDETEEALGLSSAMLASTANKRFLEDPEFLKGYRDSMGSNLILRQGEWSMHVTVRASRVEADQVAVQIAAARVPSMSRFAATAMEAFQGTAPLRRTRGALEYEETRGGQRYRTVLATRPGSPETVFRDALAELEGQHWQVLIRSSGEQQSRRFAWLVRDQAHVALCVTPAPGGNGVSLARTEVRSN